MLGHLSFKQTLLMNNLHDIINLFPVSYRTYFQYHELLFINHTMILTFSFYQMNLFIEHDSIILIMCYLCIMLKEHYVNYTMVILTRGYTLPLLTVKMSSSDLLLKTKEKDVLYFLLDFCLFTGISDESKLK